MLIVAPIALALLIAALRATAQVPYAQPQGAQSQDVQSLAPGAASANTKSADSQKTGSRQAKSRRWSFEPSFAIESTLTDNVSLTASSKRKSDWVNQFTPGLRFGGTTAHTKVAGDISVPLIVYARTSSRNYAAPEANVSATLEAIDHLLFIDTSANISQQYFSPFGVRSVSLANATQNRYAAQLYTVSPYIKGTTAGGVDFELRQRSSWSDATGVSTGVDVRNVNRIFTDAITANLSRKPVPGGWSVDFAHTDIHFGGQPGQDRETMDVAHATALYQVDPGLQVGAIGGYERNDFFATRENSAVYGLRTVWRPTDRATLNASAEHRFFGTGYSLSLDNHTPLTVWSIKASRNVSSYPRQLATLAAGVNVAGMLDALFASTVQDPAQRQSLVDQVINDRGLPLLLSSPLALYSQQVTLIQSATAMFGILGARNSIFVSAYRSRNQPVAGSESDLLSPLLAALNDNTQVGANVVWTHQLAPGMTLVSNGDLARTTDHSTFTRGTVRFYALRATVSQTLSKLTSLYAGLRYQNQQSDFSNSYREVAVFVGLTHAFR